MPTERMQRRVDALLDEVDEAAQALDWSRVRALCDGVLRLDPENADARGFLAAADRDTGVQVDATSDATASAAAPHDEPDEPLPTSFVGGRYEVGGFLGEGGRKQVYLAHDTRLDRDVAFAVIKTEGLDANGRQRIQREAEAMGRLSGHPHIVTIYDVGEEEGQPYIVSEFMAGGDVEALIGEAENHQLDLERAVAIADQVAQALEHAHAAGIVHRDLKPGNIWLADDGTAKLGDFGLAFAASDTRMTTEGTMLGTVAYMPPEQALGNAVSPHSDLYSLGCTIYEMVTGRPPFVGNDAVAVISQHLNTGPVAPSWSRADCPSALEKLIETLLAKAPEDRPDAAKTVRSELARIDLSTKDAAAQHANPLDRLARGVFVGREGELQRLRSAFDNTLGGHGELVMLVGQPGIGKTRTVQELETYARMRGAQVLWGRIHEASGAPAYWPWIQIGRAWGTANDQGALQLTSETNGELTRLFPELLGDGVAAPEAMPDPEAAQFRLFDAFTTFMRRAGELGPLMLVVDDLHWADKPSLLLLQHLARELAGMRILVVGAFRDTDLVRTHPLSETLATLNRESGFERITLRGLTRAECAGYIRSAANVDPSLPVLARIFEETEGNPFFLSEVVNLMTQEGTIEATSLSDFTIPDGVREALGRRLDRISEEGNALLQVAAVVGREFPYDTLALLSETNDEGTLRLVEEAIDARVIEELDRPGRYRFSHHLMQETLLDELSTTRRIRLHGQIGDALEQRFGDRAEERASRLAEHYCESAVLGGANAEKAIHYSRLASAQAETNMGWDEARAHWERALVVMQDSNLSALPQHLERAQHWADAGAMRHTQAAEYLRQALRIYDDQGDPSGMARCRINLGRTHSTGYRPDLMNLAQASAHFDAAAALLDGLDEPEQLVRLYNFRTTAAWNGLWIDQGRTSAASARSAAETLGTPELAAWADAFEAGLRFEAGELAAGWELVDRARAAVEARNDSVLAAVLALVEVVPVFEFLLDPEAAQAAAERELALKRMSQQRSAEFEVQRDAAVRELGEPNAGTKRVEEFRSSPERRATWHTHTQLWVAQLMLRDGIWDEAVDILRAQLEFATQAGARQNAVLMRISLARIARSRGDFADARAGLVDAAGHIPERAAGLRFVVGTELALALALEGDWSAAQREAEACRSMPTASEDWRGRFGRLRLAEALILLQDGTDREAQSAFVGSLDVFDRCSLPWDAAEAHYFWAIALRSLDRTRDAAIHLDRATEHYQALRAGPPWMERLLELRLQLSGAANADIATSIEAVAASIHAERPDLAPQAAPDGTVTLLFSDIENSTARTAELGDQQWMELLREHNTIVRDQLAAHGGYEVKSMGDGFMLAFGSALAGLRCAIGMQQAFAERNTQADETLRVRIGLHTGEAIKEADDFFGTHVNLAARIGGAAQGDEILVSGLLKALTESAGEFNFDDGRQVELKGIQAPQRVHAVEWR